MVAGVVAFGDIDDGINNSYLFLLIIRVQLNLTQLIFIKIDKRILLWERYPKLISYLDIRLTLNIEVVGCVVVHRVRRTRNPGYFNLLAGFCLNLNPRDLKTTHSIISLVVLNLDYEILHCALFSLVDVQELQFKRLPWFDVNRQVGYAVEIEILLDALYLVDVDLAFDL